MVTTTGRWMVSWGVFMGHRVLNICYWLTLHTSCPLTFPIESDSMTQIAVIVLQYPLSDVGRTIFCWQLSGA